jgi:hypothetical protein
MVDIQETVTHGPPSAKPLREVSPFGLIATAGASITRCRFCSRIRVAGGCAGSWPGGAWRAGWWPPLSMRLGAGVLWTARSWRCGFPGGWVWNRRGGQDRWAGHDARNVKNQDLTPSAAKRCDPISCKHALGCGGCVRAALADLESAYDMGAVA